MLPGPLFASPPLPALIGLSSVPTTLPSDPPCLSIGSSLAIIVIVLIATVTITICIFLLRRGCRARRLSCSSFSPRRSFSPVASVSSSAIGASRRDNATMSSLELVGVSSAPMDASNRDTTAGMAMFGLEILVPSAPSLPDVERVILELLSRPAAPIKPGSSTSCIICDRDFIPTDVLLVLPVCFHTFHQSCIISWLRRATPLCCPSCHVTVAAPQPDKTNCAPTFCSNDYDIEAQMLVPALPGEKVAEDVGGPRGWLRSSLDRLSGSWRGCSSNRTTAIVVPLSSQCTTESWSLGSSGRLCNDLRCIETQMPPSVLTVEEISEALGGFRGWLRSSLTTLSGSWSKRSSSCSTAMELPVSSRSITKTLGSSGDSSIRTCSRSWDLESAIPTPE